jgi:hypothetical protein
MRLNDIVQAMVDGLIKVDQTTTRINHARNATSNYGNYLPGVGTLTEAQFRDELADWWNVSVPGYFMEREIPYPENRRCKCDIGLVRKEVWMEDEEIDRHHTELDWAIELKYVRFVGDNGKINDYGLGKVVSPYKGQHSSNLDAMRLSKTSMGKRKAVIMYGFEFDKLSVSKCRKILRKMGLPDDRAIELEKTIRAGTYNGIWDLELIAPIYEAACKSMGINIGKMILGDFSNLSRHPNYHIGKFMAWEVLP